MSRSYRKTPIRGICSDSDKDYKQAENRRQRRAVRQALACGAELPSHRTFGDPWLGNKDGKTYFGDTLTDTSAVDPMYRWVAAHFETWADFGRSMMRK